MAHADDETCLIHDVLDWDPNGICLGANRRCAALDAKEWIVLLDALSWYDCW